jgi:hypothetical protein
VRFGKLPEPLARDNRDQFNCDTECRLTKQKQKARRTASRRVRRSSNEVCVRSLPTNYVEQEIETVSQLALSPRPTSEPQAAGFFTIPKLSLCACSSTLTCDFCNALRSQSRCSKNPAPRKFESNLESRVNNSARRFFTTTQGNATTLSGCSPPGRRHLLRRR